MIFKVPKEVKFLDSIMKRMIHNQVYSVTKSELQNYYIDTPYTKAYENAKTIEAFFDLDYIRFEESFVKYCIDYLITENLIFIPKDGFYSLTMDGIIKIQKGGFVGEILDKDLKKFWSWLLALISIFAFVLSVCNSLNN